jgi:hypothetical protein
VRYGGIRSGTAEGVEPLAPPVAPSSTVGGGSRKKCAEGIEPLRVAPSEPVPTSPDVLAVKTITVMAQGNMSPSRDNLFIRHVGQITDCHCTGAEIKAYLPFNCLFNSSGPDDLQWGGDSAMEQHPMGQYSPFDTILLKAIRISDVPRLVNCTSVLTMLKGFAYSGSNGRIRML